MCVCVCVCVCACVFLYMHFVSASMSVYYAQPVSLLLAVWDALGDEDTSVCVQVFMCRSSEAFWEEKG